MSLLDYVQEELKKIAPIAGVSTGNQNDPVNWRIDFLPEATSQEQTNANNWLSSFNLLTYNKIEARGFIKNLAKNQLDEIDEDLAWSFALFTFVNGEVTEYQLQGRPQNPSVNIFSLANAITQPLINWGKLNAGSNIRDTLELMRSRHINNIKPNVISVVVAYINNIIAVNNATTVEEINNILDNVT